MSKIFIKQQGNQFLQRFKEATEALNHRLIIVGSKMIDIEKGLENTKEKIEVPKITKLRKEVKCLVQHLNKEQMSKEEILELVFATIPNTLHKKDIED